MKMFVSALALVLSLSGPALAEPIEAMHGYSVDLGQVRGSAYYTVAPEGLYLVVVFAEGESGKPVRVSSMLAPNQRLRVAVPGDFGQSASEIEFVREGNEIVVWRPVIAMN